MRHLSRSFLFAVTALVSGCIGQIGDDDGADSTPPGANPTSFDCDPSLAPSPSPLQRLSKVQYDNSLGELLLQTLGESERDAILAAVESPLTLVPDDNNLDHPGLDGSVSQPHVDGYYHAAKALADEMTANSSRVAQLAGACATDADASNDSACVDSFIADFGARALRRPLTAEEATFYKSEVFGSPTTIEAAAIADVITVLLLAPQFLYQIEDDGEALAGAPDSFPLTDFELASRLSFHFWQSMPDEALYAAARNGELRTEEGYAAQVERLFADPRTDRALTSFFKEWIQLDDIPDIGSALQDPAFLAFAGDLPIGAETRQDMIDEVVELTRYYRSSEDGSLNDIFLSNLSFAKSESLASIYGVAPWTDGAPPEFPAGERSGLLTRAAMLSTAYTNTRPIHKGVLIRQRILCDTLGQPPPDAGPAPELEPGMTVRERVEELTEQPGSNCASCHEQLNPLGFATENYDALGRLRTQEVVFDMEGNVVDQLAIDASSVPLVDAGDNRPVDGGVELGERVVESDKLAACFSRHYFRFTFRRTEDFTRDACTLETYRTEVEHGGSLRDMLKNAAFDPAFQVRHRDPEQ